jgi:hypothetical protein
LSVTEGASFFFVQDAKKTRPAMTNNENCNFFMITVYKF